MRERRRDDAKGLCPRREREVLRALAENYLAAGLEGDFERAFQQARARAVELEVEEGRRIRARAQGERGEIRAQRIRAGANGEDQQRAGRKSADEKSGADHEARNLAKTPRPFQGRSSQSSLGFSQFFHALRAARAG